MRFSENWIVPTKLAITVLLLGSLIFTSLILKKVVKQPLFYAT